MRDQSPVRPVPRWPQILGTGMLLLFVLPDAAAASDFPVTVRAQAIGATVGIRALPQETAGSGTLIGKSGPFVYILTAQHVVKGAEHLEVTLFLNDTDSIRKPYRSANVIAELEGLADLALIRLATADEPPLIPVCRDPKSQKLAGKLLAVGCGDAGKPPTGLLETAVKRLVRREGNELVAFWEVAHKHVRGRSGGALVDRRGYLVGVCSGTNREKTYFTHVGEIHRFLKRNGFRWLIDDSVKPEK